MNNQFKFNFAIEKEHPWKTDGFTELEAFKVLQTFIAKNPNEAFYLNDAGFRLKDTMGQTYIITLQE